MVQQYDYIIVGMGPTGLTLGLSLMRTDKTVLFVEADSDVGGCWRTRFTHDGYFTEHSPKVLSRHGTHQFNRLLRFLGVAPDYRAIDPRSSFLRKTKGMLKQFAFADVFKLILYFVTYLVCLNDKWVSVRDWCAHNRISTKGRNYLNIVSVVLSNTYEKLTMHALFRFVVRRHQYMRTLDQVAEPHKWVAACYNLLKTNPNFTFRTNTLVGRVVTEGGRVTQLITTDSEGRETLALSAKEFVMCVPVRALFKIMQRSREPNWFKSTMRFKRFADRATYTGIGFQLHYTDFVPVPEEWCWSCFGDWKIIVLDKTYQLKRLSYDLQIKQVLSCVIVDMDTKSHHLGKSANECVTLDEIVCEGYRQVRKRLHKCGGRPPHKITVSRDIARSPEFGWEARDSSFSPIVGSLPWRGRLDNLYTVGPHNQMHEVVVIDTAIESAKAFATEVLQTRAPF